MISKLSKPVLFFISIVFSLSAFSAHAKEVRQNISAHRAAGKFADLNLADLPVWSKDVYKKRFKEIRDKKFVEFEGKVRRVPWLYGRDGCHMRSTHFTQEATRLGYTTPKKVFIFGNLEIRGAIIPRGAVQPWFHAAPIVQVDGQAMVLDPSISFSRPLTLETWASYVAIDPNKTIYSICDANTYLPTTSCSKPGPLDFKRLNQETKLYLKFEKNIMRNLGLVFE